MISNGSRNFLTAYSFPAVERSFEHFAYLRFLAGSSWLLLDNRKGRTN